MLGRVSVHRLWVWWTGRSSPSHWSTEQQKKDRNCKSNHLDLCNPHPNTQIFVAIIVNFTIWFAQYINRAIAPSSFLGYSSIGSAHLDLDIFAPSSSQNCSGSVRLHGLWLGYSNSFRFLVLKHYIIALAICLGLLSCWKENLLPSFKSPANWDRFV